MRKVQSLLARLRSYNCKATCQRSYIKTLHRGYCWTVAVFHTPYTHWSAQFLTLEEACRFLQSVFFEVSHA